MRTRFTDLSQPEIIRPVAAPVNSYVRPADPAPSPLHGLASGLADLSEGVSSFMGKRQQTTDKESAAKAEALFNANHQLGWAEAQKQGLIPAQYNPVFAKAYKQAQGNYAGVVLRQKFQKAYDAWDGKGSENPEDFNKFFSDFVAQNVDPNADPSVLEGLNPHVSKLMEDGTSMWTNDSSVAMRKRSDATHAALDGNDMDAAHEDPKPDYQKMWTNIQTRREAALASGTTAEAYDAGIVKSAAMKAVELDDEKLIDFIAKQPIPGNKDGLKYEDIPEFNDAIKQAKTQISTENRARKNFEYTQQERDDKKAREDLMIGVQTQLAIDPKATIPEEVYKKGEAAGWATMRKDVIDIKKSMLDDREAEDKRNILDLDIGITTGETTRETLWDAAKKGVIRDPQTWDRLQQKLKAYDEDKLKGYNLFDNERVKFWKQSFIQRSQTDGFASKVFGDSLALNDEAVQATGDYNGMLMDWIKANPEEAKNPANIYAKADEFGKIIAQRFDMKQLPDSGNRYRGTEDQANALFTAGAQDAKTTAFDKQKSDVAAPVPVSKWYQDNAPPNYKTLDPEAQKAIEDGAAAVGKSPEEFNKMLWENMKRWQEQQPQKDGMLQNQSSPIGNEVGGLIQTAYTDAQTQADNPVSDSTPIVSLIGHSEGTDKGAGYDETLGYGKFTNGPVDLTHMTMAEVDALQTKMLQHPANDLNSSAVGRYQAIRTTLRDWRRENDIPDTAVFDKKMQDKFAHDRLQFRGLDQWKAGELTDEQFARNLADEWASLPTGPSGKSAYPGQRASVSWKQVLTSLKATRDNGGDPFASILGGDTKPADTGVIPAAYSKLPPEEAKQFAQWNSDPIANDEPNRKSVDPQLGEVIKLAREKSGVKFVVGAGKRTAEQQKKAVEWGWSKTMKSDHLDGGAADLWAIGEDGAIDWSPEKQDEIAKAMKAAAAELGYTLDWGGDWKSFKDRPHFAIKRNKDISA